MTKVLNTLKASLTWQCSKKQDKSLRLQMVDPPSREELEKALSKMKGGKAGGSYGTGPDVVMEAAVMKNSLMS